VAQPRRLLRWPIYVPGNEFDRSELLQFRNPTHRRFGAGSEIRTDKDLQWAFTSHPRFKGQGVTHNQCWSRRRLRCSPATLPSNQRVDAPSPRDETMTRPAFRSRANCTSTFSGTPSISASSTFAPCARESFGLDMEELSQGSSLCVVEFLNRSFQKHSTCKDEVKRNVQAFSQCCGYVRGVFRTLGKVSSADNGIEGRNIHSRDIFKFEIRSFFSCFAGLYSKARF